jgi:hypothetical protein
MEWLRKLREELVKASELWPDVCNAIERIVVGLAVLVMFLMGVGYICWRLIEMHLK